MNLDKKNEINEMLQTWTSNRKSSRKRQCSWHHQDDHLRHHDDHLRHVSYELTEHHARRRRTPAWSGPLHVDVERLKEEEVQLFDGLNVLKSHAIWI